MSKGSVSQRLRMALNREEGMKSLDKVVEQYGYVDGEPFTFKDHEFQIELVRDTSFRIDVQKCSQVGLTEMMAQKSLAIMAVMKNIRIMFSQPTKEMATKFSKDRIDGAIEQSEFYSGLVKAGSDASGMKKMGQNLLYIIGTYGANSAISVPAEMIISDETDFSNETVLGKLNSRLRHAKSVDEFGNRGYRYRFSTPTVTGFGINTGFMAGDQRYYMCKCEHCEQWVVPDYMHDFIIPGWDKGILEFGRDNLDDERIDVTTAWIKCPNTACQRDLWKSLIQPERRQWVAKRPENNNHSYQVYPWDVPKYNTPSNILGQYEGYPLKSDFFNFVIGLPFADADNSFSTDAEHKRRQCIVDRWIFGQWQVLCETVGGMDIGKTCHFLVKAKVGPNIWHVVHMEKITNTKLDPACPKVLARYDFYRIKKLCIDAGPDITLVNLLVGAREGIQAVVYTTVAGFMPVVEKQGGDVINADRTKTLTLTMNAHNANEMFYPHADELKNELYEHLGTTKKIRERNTDGEVTEKFIKTNKQDHWVHALNYAGIAALALDFLNQDEIVATLPRTATVAVGSKPVDGRDKEEVGHVLHGMFGMSRSKGSRGR